MTLDQVKALSNSALVDIFAESVMIDHYDPFETPQIIVELRKNGITSATLERLILERMK